MTILAMNLLLALVWLALTGEITPLNFALGFAAGYAALRVVRRALPDTAYFGKLSQLVRFVLFFLVELVKANLRVAYDVLTPTHHMQPGVVAIPLDLETDEEITLLATLITLTPHLSMKSKSLSLTIALAALFMTTNASAQSTPDTDRTRAVITQYLESNHTDLSMMADDVVFINMATGQRHTGREEVAEMLHFVYHVAFDARAETRNVIVDGDHAVLEAEIVGKHIGEFAGVAPTNKDVRIPLAVVYDLEEGQIKEGRIYFELPALLAQLK